MTGELTGFITVLGIGAAVAAPVGPMSLLCMRRTLAHGVRCGVATGTGIAAGDACYALVAAFGLASVTRFAAAYERPLHAAAGVFLLSLAWRAWSAPVSEPAFDRVTARGTPSAASAGVSAWLLTLTNPPTIVSFAAIFTAFAPTGFGPSGALARVSGVFLGSLGWWLLVILLVSSAGRALGPRTRRWIDRIACLLLGACGAAEVTTAMMSIRPATLTHH